MKLTESQKKLIEDNLPFCYFYFQQHQIYSEDRQQALLESLCYNIHLYDSSRGTITTFITQVFQSKFSNLRRSEQTDKRKANNNAKLLSTPIYRNEVDDSEMTLEDTLIAIEDGIDKVENQMLIDNVFKNLSLDKTISERDVKLFLTYLDTQNYTFVGKLFGISTQRVNEIVDNIKKKLVHMNYIIIISVLNILLKKLLSLPGMNVLWFGY